MKEPPIKKPILNTSQAVKFATEFIQNENQGDSIGSAKITAQESVKALHKKRTFFAPNGDRRLTINLNADLHKKLKIAAINQEISAGEIVERLIKQYL